MEQTKTNTVQLSDVTNVRETFLALTRTTCPHGEEVMYYDALTELGFQADAWGNFWATVGGGDDTGILFAAHLDTVGRKLETVKHTFSDDERFVYSDGTTILGADDKAGVAVLLYMHAHGVPGTYALFIGEEVGCVGSGLAADQLDMSKYRACISFDRAGYDDVITHQAGRRTASDAFANALAAQLNAEYPGIFEYTACPNGVYTDSNQFADVIPECTNVSVGYFKQHGTEEVQDILWLESLAYACLGVAWQELPIKRDPSEVDYSPAWGRYSYVAPTKTKGKGKGKAKSKASSDALSYVESVYGSGLEMWPMEDTVEFMDYLSDDEAARWVARHPRKVVAFIREVINYHGAIAASCAKTADEEV